MEEAAEAVQFESLAYICIYEPPAPFQPKSRQCSTAHLLFLLIFMLEGVGLRVNMSELDGPVLLQMAHQHAHLGLHKARPHQEDVLGHTLRHDHYVVSACCKCEVGEGWGW